MRSDLLGCLSEAVAIQVGYGMKCGTLVGPEKAWLCDARAKRRERQEIVCKAREVHFSPRMNVHQLGC